MTIFLCAACGDDIEVNDENGQDVVFEFPGDYSDFVEIICTECLDDLIELRKRWAN